MERKLDKEPGAVLLACMRIDKDSREQERAFAAVSELFKGKLAFWVVDERGGSAFGARHRIVGTPTFLLFLHGEEQGRLLGRAESDELLRFVRMHSAREVALREEVAST